MKKLLLLSMLLFSVLPSFGQVSYGKFVMFPDNKLSGSYWKPQITFCKVNDNVIIAVRCCNSTAYKNYDEDSRILIRFADSTVYKLPILENSDIVKDFQTSSAGYSVTSMYITYAFYTPEEEIIEKICNEKIPIVKIRLVFANGEVSDYDITTKYQSTLLNGLINSLKQANAKNEQKARNMNDEDF